MNKKYIISLFSVFFLAGVSMPALAQEDVKKKEEDLRRELTLEREFSPTVQDANKVNVLPEIKEPSVIKRNIEFSRFVLPVQPTKEITTLPSGKILTDIDYSKKRGYFNFGIGNYMNINGDFGYHILSTATDQLNVFFSHRSTNGKVKYLKEYSGGSKTKQKLNDNLGGINYSHSFPTSTLTMGASYGYTGFNYYGYPFAIYIDRTIASPPLGLDMEEMPNENQANQTFNAHIGVASKENVDLGYNVDFGFMRFAQKYASDMLLPNPEKGLKENRIYGSVGLYKPFLTDQRIGATAKVNYFTYGEPEGADSLSKHTYGNYMELTLNPYYQVDGDIWNLRLGANIMFITGVNDKVFVSPDITAQIKAGEKAVVYLNATGGIQSNSFQAVSQENRYISSMFRPIPSKTKLDATLGVRANLGAGAWMNIYGGYRITDHELFYSTEAAYLLSDPNVNSNESSVAILYKNDLQAFQRNTGVLKVGASFNYNYQNMIEFGLRGEYKNWNVKGDIAYNHENASAGQGFELFNDLKPYGKPTFELDANIKLSPIKQLMLDINYYAGTGRQALLLSSDLKPTNRKMDAIHDLNVMGTWKINDMFSVYAKANNLLFQKYDLFYGYPSQGLSLMGGFNINF